MGLIRGAAEMIKANLTLEETTREIVDELINRAKNEPFDLMAENLKRWRLQLEALLDRIRCDELVIVKQNEQIQTLREMVDRLDAKLEKRYTSLERK
jgi:polyhydroxyalkanoate synthesis regulator phasin